MFQHFGGTLEEIFATKYKNPQKRPILVTYLGYYTVTYSTTSIYVITWKR